MRLLIKQRVFSWRDAYDVYDEQQQRKYIVKSEAFSFGHQIHIYDLANREVGAVKQELLTWLPKFRIEIGGREVGTVEKEFTFFYPKYTINYKGWVCEGDFLAWDYDVTCGGRSVAQIHKELFRWGDTYVIEINNPADEIAALTLCIAIDAAICTQEQTSSAINNMNNM